MDSRSRFEYRYLIDMKAFVFRVGVRCLLLLLIVVMFLPIHGAASTTNSFTYVAMGDSVASGHGLFSETSNPGCRRSPVGYPGLLRLLMKKEGWSPTLVNVACSGESAVEAETTKHDDFTKYVGHPASQVEVVEALRPSPRLVTITLGIDSTEWSSALVQWANRNGKGCPDVQAVIGYHQTVRHDLRLVLDDVAPHAGTVLVTGYYNPFPSHDVAKLLRELGLIQGHISTLLALFSNRNCADVAQTAIDDVTVAITEAISDSRRAGHDNIQYVDISPAIEADRDQNIQAPSLADFTLWPHPSSAGAFAIAQTLLGVARTALASNPGQTATALVVDVSGSMGEGFSGQVKIDAAKAAAQQVVQLVQQDTRATGIQHRLALVSFSSTAHTVSGLTSATSSVSAGISSLQPLDSTDLGAGLQMGLDALRNAPERTRAVILLSDGLTNVGLSADQILAGPVQDARRNGIKVYTVGFGDPGSLDEGLLRQIAGQTGGSYSLATAPWPLATSFLLSRQASTGNVVGNFRGQVSQGQTVRAGSIAVPPGAGQLQLLLSWPGSILDLIATDPQGNSVRPGYPGARLFMASNPAYLIIADPIAGRWVLRVRGVQTSGPEDFLALASTRAVKVRGAAATSNSGGQLGVVPLSLSVLVVLLGLSAGVALLTVRRSKGQCPSCGAPIRSGWRTCPSCRYPVRGGLLALVVSGPDANRRLLISSGDTFGRDAGAAHVLRDPTVSRLHGSVQWTGGEWTIRDLGSSRGILRNGESILRGRLHPGDRISLGQTEIVIEGEA
jgi:von Willebrand factor type A domain/FHA domain